MYITRQAVELCDDNGAFQAASLGQREGELRAAIQRVASFALLDFDELRSDL